MYKCHSTDKWMEHDAGLSEAMPVETGGVWRRSVACNVDSLDREAVNFFSEA